MTEFKVALKMANDYFSKEDGLPVTQAMDAETHWIFYAVPEEGPALGNAGVKIEKATGKLEDFILPDDENFELLDRAKAIEIPPPNRGRFFVVK